MVNSISSVHYLIVAALIFFYAAVSLSYAFTDDLSIIENFHDQDVVSLGHLLPSTKIKAVYQFGDSILDTGNFIQEEPLSVCAKFPYGETFFGKPTGRCSNGLLMIDYFTMFFNLPFLDPYLNKRGNFTHGVNFAVAGATTLNISTLGMKGIVGLPTNSSLFVQLDWFKSHLNSICSNASDRKEILAKALIMMGEIGTNDYLFALFRKKSIARIYEMVPEVVQTIKIAIKEVINLGAIHVVVPGILPVGCIRTYLNIFKTNDSRMYDELQCLSYLNDFAKFHNNKVQEVIRELQKDYANVSIQYADYFVTFREILRHATSLGFDKGTMGKTCWSMSADYGNPVCENPYKYIFWDEAHLTQHTYHIMAECLMKNMFYDSSYPVLSS